MANTRVFVGGEGFTARMQAEALDRFDDIQVVEDARDADVVYWIYPDKDMLRTPSALVRRRPIVLHWIGSDVSDFASPSNVSIAMNRSFIRCLDRLMPDVRHVAVAPWLVDELRACGIRANLVPISTVSSSPPPSSDDRDVDFLAYVPYAKRRFYGIDHIRELAGSMPTRRFIAIQPEEDGDLDLPDNVEVRGRVPFDEMGELYGRCKVLLRMPGHDGLSRMVLEAMAHGMHVVWINQFPHTIPVEEASVGRLEALLDDFHENVDGRDMVLRDYSADVAIEGLRSIIIDSIGDDQRTIVLSSP